MAPVANAVVDKGSGSQVSKLSKKIVKFSSSGRKITVPKKILPTSSDEMPPRKPKQSVADMQKELNELRSLAKQKEYASKLQANDSILRSEIKIKNKVPNKISITASDALITKNNPSSSSHPTQKKAVVLPNKIQLSTLRKPMIPMAKCPLIRLLINQE